MDDPRLRWRCRRGLLELDLLLAGFLQGPYASLAPAEKCTFAALVELQDRELWALITGAEAPTPAQAVVIASLRASPGLQRH